MTPRLQRRVPVPCAATFGGTVHSDLLKLPLLRWAIAIVAALWLLGGAAEHAWHTAVTVEAAQQSGSSSSGALAVNADHARCDSGSPSCLVAMAVVDVPRWDDAFWTYAGLAAVAAIGCRFDLTRQTKRGPPRGPATPVAGQDLLTRFCLARR